MKHPVRHDVTWISLAALLSPMLAYAGGCFTQEVGIGSDAGGGQGGSGGAQMGVGGAGGAEAGVGGAEENAGGSGGAPIPPAPGWPKRLGHISFDRGHGVATDAAGNVLVTGDFKDKIDFGGGPIQGAAGRDAYLAKYSESGGLLWARTFGAKADDRGKDLAVGSNGDVVVTGFSATAVDFGGGPVGDVGQGIFLARFDAAGNHLWSKKFGNYTEVSVAQEGRSVAVDAAGSVFLLAGDGGTIDFGDGPLVNAGHDDIYMAKFDAAGTLLWSKRIGGPDVDHGVDIAVDSAGNVVLAGWTTGTADLGGGPLTSAGGADLVVAKYDPDGNHLWSKIFGDAAPNQTPTAVAVDGSDAIVISGTHAGTVDYGGGPLTSAKLEVLLLKLDAAGDHVFSRLYVSTGGAANYIWGLDVSAAGTIAVTGQLGGDLDLGAGPLIGWANDVFWAKLDAAGNHLSSGVFGGDSWWKRGADVAISPTGSLFVTGYFEETFDVDGVSLVSPGPDASVDIFVAKVP